MKNKSIILILTVILAALPAGAQQIGKSMGRWKDFGLESMISNHERGLDYIEVTMNNVMLDKDPATAASRAVDIMKDITASGLKVWSVHMPYSRKWDISVIDDSLRAANIEFFSDMIRVAGTFKPKFLVLHPSAEPIAPEERAQRLANSHNSIGLLAPVAKEIGAVLCIENLPRTCLGQNAQEMMQLIDGYEEVGLCFDTNHLLYQSHEDYLAGIPKGKIKTVHLSDYDFKDERHWLPGKGNVAWLDLWKGIRENGYDGIMMFECYGEPEELLFSKELILGEDSVSFANAKWEIKELQDGAVAMYASIPMFGSVQSVCAVKYPSGKFRTEILNRPGDQSGKTSAIASGEGARLAVNGGYFHVKERVPSVYFRVGDEVYGHTHPTEVYRVDGVVGLKDKKGKKVMIARSDTSNYENVAGKWHSVMASGPMLIEDSEIVVPVKTGDKADGANVEAMKAEMKSGSKIRTHYSSSQFYDKRHPRAAIGTDDKGNVYYVVIDGRFKGQAAGASIYETAYICRLLGMTNAINLDGGGSSTLWAEEAGVINHPYDNKKFDHEGERSVPNLIVAY